MQRVKVKKNKNIDMKKISKMFNQMLGTEEGNSEICNAKYLRVVENVLKLTKLYKLLEGHMNRIVKTDDFTKHINELSEYLNSNPSYKDLKKSTHILNIIKETNFLAEYKVQLSTENANFIITNLNKSFKPFTFNNICLRELICIHKLNKQSQKFIVVCLFKIYQYGLNIYEDISSPDFDIDDFISVISTMLEQLKKEPKLNRCGRAFDVIKSSLGLFKENFKGYYKDFLNTKDNTIIMQNFMIDVSKNVKSDAVLAGQFKEIIKYYKELSQNSKHPDIEDAIDQFNEELKKLNENSGNLNL